MKNRSFILNTALAVVMTVALAVCILLRTFCPWIIIPALNIPNMALLSLIALLADYYLARDAKRCYICTFLFSAIIFGVLPYAAGFTAGWDVLKLAVVGGVVFTLLTVLFTSVQERLSSGPAAKAAPLLSAFGLYLAFQIFANIII